MSGGKVQLQGQLGHEHNSLALLSIPAGFTPSAFVALNIISLR